MIKNPIQPTTLIELLRLRAQTEPDKRAYTFLADGETETASLTYAQLELKAQVIAAKLQSLVGIGERALLLYPSGLDYIAAFFGCLYANVIAVPAYPPRRNRSDQRLQAIAADAQATVILTTTEIFSKKAQRLTYASELENLHWITTDNLASELASRWQLPKIDSETLAFLQYTSGSTGTPKGVMVSHGNLLHNSEYIRRKTELTANTVSVTWLPSFHDMGLMNGLIQPLYTGFLSLLMSPLSFLQKPIRWLQAISRYQVTYSGGPNFAYELCVRKITTEQRESLDLSCWCAAYNGSEPIRRETLERFVQYFEPCGFQANFLYPCYGLAENTVAVSGGFLKGELVYSTVEKKALEQGRVVEASHTVQEVKQLVGCGQAELDTKIVIVNPETLRPCASNEVGEIWVSGASVAQGYWNRVDETEQTFHAYLSDTGEGPFLRTGDLGFLKEGELFVTGRLKDLIIIRGGNYYPQDIEQTAEQSHPALRSNGGAAFSVDIAGEERLVIAQEVERTALRGLDVNEVINTIRQVVSQRHDLQLYAVLLLKPATLPKTSSGKVQRRACRIGFLEGTLKTVAMWQQEISEKPRKSLSQQNNDFGTLTTESIQTWLLTKLSQHLKVATSELDIQEPLARYGLDSMTAVSLSGELETWLGRSLSPTIVYDYPNIQALSHYLAGEPTSSQKTQLEQKTATEEAIAIIGMGCRFPGAENPDAFWQLLHDGKEAITEVPASRWDINAFYDPNPEKPGKMNTRWGGFLNEVAEFDPQFFSISPLEAQRMDPQQRLLLEVSWEALENASIAPDKLTGSQTGVFIGISTDDYVHLQSKSDTTPDAYTGSGNASSIAANRLSYLWDLHGPSVAIDTACSSSLVAVHQACQSLRFGECHLALAGGVNLILTPDSTITFSQAGMLAADGHCKTFDANADGYVRGEGCGIVVHKRVSKAVRDGDNILALIKGSAINQDGRTNGLTAPNGLLQQAVVRQALENADIAPNQLNYVEAHGTGTSLGDPIEVNALKEVLMEGRTSEQPCWIGSVKTNIGHLEAAAGIAGLIKVVLSLQHQEIFPHLHLNELNPLINLADTPIKIPSQRAENFPTGENPVAGVSSFGFGGTNAHIVLEKAPLSEVLTSEAFSLERPKHLLTLSAKNEPALQALAQRYETYLQSNSTDTLANIGLTANTGRTHFNHRLAIIADSTIQLREQLNAFNIGKSHKNREFRGVLKSNHKPPKIAFLFTGQGSQYVGMGRELYETNPSFRQTLEHCDDILRPYLETPLQKVLYQNDNDLDNTAYTQPALFALEYALAELWQSWGIKPAVVMGHSLGEYVAACVAGVFSLEDGLKLVAERAHLMQSLPQTGEMVAVFANQAQVTAALAPYTQLVSIAALNEPNNVVISGESEAIFNLVTTFEKNRIETRQLQVSHAFHSPLMEPMLDAFEQLAREVSFQKPRIPLISNVTGQILEQVPDAQYWRTHTRSLVNFLTGIKTLFEQDYEDFLEIGPKPVLSQLGKACQPSTAIWLPSLKQKQTDWHVLLSSLATLYVQGAEINWNAYEKDYPRRRLSSLPTYPFQRQHYWINQQGSIMPKPISDKNTQTPQPIQSRKDSILSTVRALLAELLQLAPAEIEATMPLVEMGADSLVIAQAIRRIESHFGLTFTLRQIFEELNTPEALASYIAQQLPEEVALTDSTPAQPPLTRIVADSNNWLRDGTTTQELAKTAPDTVLERIMSQQIQAMSQQASQQTQAMSQLMSQQLAVLRGTQQGTGKQQRHRHRQSDSKDKVQNSPLPPWRVAEIRAKGLSSQQQHHLEALIARYTQKTPTSKQLSQHYRPVLADSRASAGFRLSTKEMLYPIVGKRAQGSKTWDVDGNEYLDITMGFGVNLFGHQPKFITEAIEKQLKENLQLGLQTPLGGEVAELICDLTGMERVTFCNSGTEAVMTALRLACTATGRDKIVQFAMSYHGHFDGTLGEALSSDEPTAIPMAPGVKSNMVADVLVLDYGNFHSLEMIQAHADELAAVLVEPVQSRRPNLQPKEFLLKLRQLTLKEKIPLIFDEMITGFRIHPGGAQAWFGVQADIATYGKIVGGGMPIGVVAGKAAYLDGIDGGFWNYGDASYPQAETTFFAGTFCKHPLAMAASLAVMREIKQQGPTLQEQLNQRTTRLVETLNSYFEAENVPIRIWHFGSLFRFSYSGNLDLLFYHLLEKGVYIWEGRNCFLSTAHTDEDIEYFIKAVKESVEELRQGGFLPENTTPPTTGNQIKAESHERTQSASAISPTTLKSTKAAIVAHKTPNLPLTEAQKQLWVLTQMGDGGSLAYNVHLHLQLRGQLNLSAMHQAVQQVVNRHEALRTVISREGDFQQCLPSVSIEVPVVDLSGKLAQERESTVTSFLEQQSCQPFNLTQSPLIRVHLVKLEKQRHLLVLTAHHIIVDGLSMSLIIQEIGAFYSAACQQITCQLEPPLQFRDFLEWQTLQTTEMAAQEAYWLEKFYESIPVLNLPTDHPYPPTRYYRGNRQTVRLQAKLCQNLKTLSQKQGCTPFMTYLSAYTIWLYRITGQNDILVGIPVAGRNLEGSDNLVGYCTHLLPIKTHIAGPETFFAYLKTLRGILLDAYEHQDYPFANLIEQLNLPRQSSHTPLVSVIFNLDKPSERPTLFELEVEWFSQPLHFTAFDISINLTDIGEELVLDCDYNTDLFNPTTIERFVGHFQVLLEGIVNNPTQALSQLPLLTEAEQQQLIAWNQTQTDYPLDKTIVDLFQEQVDKTPANIAVVFEGQSLTYQELNFKANQLAHYLIEQRVEAETLVGICVERSLEMVIGLLGILKAGGAYVPLDPEYPAPRLQFMLEDSQVSVLLTQTHFIDRLPPTPQAKLVGLDRDWTTIAVYSGENQVRLCCPENLAYVIYTSGSTGKPKGAMNTHQGICNRLLWMQDAYQLTVADNVLQKTPFSFDVSVWEFFWPLLVGARLTVAKQGGHKQSDYLIKLLEQEQITTLHFVPSMLQVFLQEPTLENGHSLKRVICSGEALPIELQARFFARLPAVELHNLYGPTEAAVDVTSWACQPGTRLNSVPIGRPIANTQIYILDAHHNPIPIGVPGELCIAGNGLARGYLNRPELTLSKFIEVDIFGESKRLYKTGDLARWREDGNLEYLGRLDLQVKLRGFRIELGEIEATLTQHEAVSEAVVLLIKDEGNPRLAAYVTLATPTDDTASVLRTWLKARLPDYMLPASVTVLDKIPLTPNGKIDRNALPAPDLAQPDALKEPQSEVERLLSQIWSEVLGYDITNTQTDFFEAGGHSLLATQLVSRIRERFAIEMPLKTVFEHTRLQEQANWLAHQQRGTPLPPLTPLTEGEPLVLSFAQLRLWFLAQLEGPSATYNMPAALRLQGELSQGALALTFVSLIEHHVNLRLCFPDVEGQATVQVKPVYNPLRLIDLSALPVEKLKHVANHLIEAFAFTPFDLTTGPLMRVQLLKLKAHEHLLLFNMHHIISDGWSISVLIRQWSEIYDAYVQNRAPELPASSIQYTDYAAWQRRWLEGELLERQLSYWKEQLAGAPALLELPIDYSRPAVLTYQGAQLQTRLTSELTQRLKSFSQQNGVTLYMTLLTAFQILLSRYSGQPDILVGSPIANRTHRQTEDIIGFFVNTLVLRTQINGAVPVTELLKQVRQTALQAYAHQDIPFEYLVEQLNPTRSFSHSPLFQVMLVLQNVPQEQRVIKGLKVSIEDTDTTIAKFDLTLSITEHEDMLVCDWEYRTDLFRFDTIKRMTEHFEVLLEGLINQPTQTVGQLPLLTHAEQQQLIAWNQTQTGYPVDKTLVDLFQEQVEKNPGKFAVVFEGQSISYQALNSKANQLAHYLIEQGVEAETLVGICVERSLEMIIGLLGILKAGGAYVPLDPDYPLPRLQFLLEDSQVSVLLTQTHLIERLPIGAAKVVDLDRDWATIAAYYSSNPERQSGPDNLAYVIYTSGSTGKPKGCQVTQLNVTRLFATTSAWYHFNQEDVWTLFHSYAFDFSVWELWGALLYGGQLVVVPHETSRTPEAFYQLLIEQRVTVLNQTPSAFKQLIDVDNQPNELSLRLVIFGGEALDFATLQPWFAAHGDRPPQLINMYGITETTVHVTYYPLISEPNQKSLIGSPLPDLQVWVVDAHHQPVPIGVPGEMYVGGAGVTRGYLNRPELTNEKFIEVDIFGKPKRLYKTGDLARRREDGNLEYLGRLDHQVKLRGFRIELGEIEATLTQHEAVREAVVVLTKDEGNPRLAAYLTLATPRDDIASVLRTWLKARLPDYMLPASFTVLEKLPLTPNGKIDRNALPVPDLATTKHYQAPRTDTEQHLVEVWQHVLKQTDIGIHDNFFERGGDSILSIQIVARARAQGFSLSPRDLFQHQTIAELALVVQPEVDVKAEQGLVTGDVPLTPIQQAFFARKPAEPWHFNQAIFLTVPADINPAALQLALAAILEHHDALRLRFQQTHEGWQQWYARPEPELPFQTEDLTALALEHQSRVLTERANVWQTSFNLEQGPLVRLVLFQLGVEARLLWCIHHLVVDGVSWRILLEDLHTAYHQALADQPRRLPEKTSAFKAWAEQLEKWRESDSFLAQAEYWHSLPKTTDLPVDNPLGRNRHRSAAHYTIRFSIEVTQRLLTEAPAAYRTQINDLLLTALMLTLREWSGQIQHLIDLESHGRTDLFGDLDLSRTVGWFTSLHTLSLTLPTDTDLGHALKAIKEQLRQVPNEGVGYGVLRYLCQEPLPQGQILFNYLGQFDQTVLMSEFRFAEEDSGRAISPQGEREHLLEINGQTIKGCLSLTWSYSADQYQTKTIQRLADHYQQQLTNLIEHCATHFGYTPSDFPLASLSQNQLDEMALDNNGHNLADIYPLSPMQQGMLFHTLYAPDSGIYFEQLHCSIVGDLNVTAFRQAWQALIDRHPILRTAFWHQGSEPLQVVYKTAQLHWQRLDWRELSEEQRTQELQSLLTKIRQQGFELSKAPLMRVQLIQETDQKYRLVWHHHHLLMDGWCLPILFSELFEAYQAFCNQLTPSLPPRRSYRDYIHWLSQQDLKAAKSYWQEQLHGFYAPTPLVGRQTTNDQPADYQEQELTLDTELTEQLERFSRQHRLTVNTLVQGAWACLLSRYSGETDVVFGVTTSGRQIPLWGIDQMLGLFINTLPLRVQVASSELIDWLRSIQHRQQQNDQYAYTPLVDIQTQSDVPGGVALFESLLVFENYPIDDRLKDDTFKHAQSFAITEVQGIEYTNYPITLAVVPGPRLHFKLAYDSRRFNSTSIKRMLAHLSRLLYGMVTQPSLALHQLPILTQAEQQQLIAWNQTETDYPLDNTIVDLFQEQVDKTPSNLALVFEGQSLTYQELNSKANQLAHYLIEQGVQAETLVGICVERSIEMVIGLLGILKAGGAYVPLDPEYPVSRLQFMLEDSQVPVLLTQSHLIERLPAYQAKLVDLDCEWARIAAYSGSNPVRQTESENLAYVIYTSGSTGKPKGVMVTHKGYQNLTTFQKELLIVTTESRILQFASLSFDATCWELAMAIPHGAQFHLSTADKLLPSNTLITLLKERRISHLTLPPSVLTVLPQETLPHLQFLVVAGEASSSELVTKWSSGRKLINAYGPTESTVCATLTECQPDGNSPPIGKPIANTQIYILDAHHNPTPQGIPGELCIAGRGLARGYLNRPELTLDKFIEVDIFGEQKRLYKTGDLARWREDGNLEYLGRLDHQVKLRGFRIELGEIEATLTQHEAVREAVVVLIKDEGNPHLAAYLTLATPIDDCATVLRNWLKARLPEYMLPASFTVLDKLPLTPNGKIDRKALPAADGLSTNKRYQGPRDTVELQLAQIWANVLEVRPIGISDNFFELGGHSLLAVKLMNHIQQTFDLHLPIATLFQGATIAELASVIRIRHHDTTWPTLIPIQPQGSRSPLFCLPGGGGNVLYLHSLAAHLDKDQPCYGLQPPGLDGKTTTPNTIEVLAAHHLKELQGLQPQGPYYLVGHCFGGKVAFELARQLEQSGETVALLTILDSSAPTSDRTEDNTTTWNEIDWLWIIVEIFEELTETEIGLTKETLQSQATVEQSYELVMQHIKQQGIFFAPTAESEQLKAIVDTYKANVHAQLHYQPQGSIKAPIVLFRAQEQPKDKTQIISVNEEDWNWSQYTSEKVTVEWTPGTHLTMFNEPHVKTLAAQLYRHLFSLTNMTNN
jgi:amino acid adenylation domain-containing protein/non-ribosomal peptide synthase protein (TIGR01720 family)